MELINLETWVIADTHFFDRSPELINLRPTGWQETLINNWKHQVLPDETILHLGDLSLCSGDELRGLIPCLPGRITLLRGNHDKFPSEFYRGLGIQIAVRAIDQLLEYNQTEYWLRFSHEPEPELMPRMLNIHGHTHGLPTPFTGKPGYIDASPEALNYHPCRLREILDKEIN